MGTCIDLLLDRVYNFLFPATPLATPGVTFAPYIPPPFICPLAIISVYQSEFGFYNNPHPTPPTFLYRLRYEFIPRHINISLSNGIYQLQVKSAEKS